MVFGPARDYLLFSVPRRPWVVLGCAGVYFGRFLPVVFDIGDFRPGRPDDIQRVEPRRC